MRRGPVQPFTTCPLSRGCPVRPSGAWRGDGRHSSSSLAKPVPLACRQESARSIAFPRHRDLTARLADDARRLRHLAATDDLTGLHNLRSFEPRLDAMVRACRVARVPMAMLVLDLDRLKSLNDTHGHRAGGEAVRTLGHVLSVRLPANAVAWSSASLDLANGSRRNKAIIARLREGEIARPAAISNNKRATASVLSLFRCSKFGPSP